ncbi:cysteine--tRNA ligase [Gloeobacter morelensis]|uniref:Cysteine--tRNA ligase n=1 Tax=Gloeobacter morelensis MG652769 TaxID=2781736 RepID=A0ABY3PSI7_9CYAN|nr:cysteine--tRNA ligase [Gloeobacter morelensis]UFP96621.1 cysteine--tRNA ligase [Gloeobacter morelensis MG652769]
MALQIYNTLTRRKEPFVPLAAGKVKMYVCGVTVYDYCHLGHGRTYVVWDTVRRYLVSRGYAVTYVQNFTDVDDKILRRAQQEGTTMEAVSERYIAAYFEDMDRLNVLRADSYPRATQTMPEIAALIDQLTSIGYAYAAAGDVYYSVRRFAEYGKLSGKRLAELEAGASERLQDEELARKKDPFDFALWKGSKPGEPAWESPWGAGRPGWHIECSAMVKKSLGETIDIHAGGEDLQFPHHENEIAQSEAVTGKPLARYWMHNAFLNVVNQAGTEEKMSKSLGNFKTLRDLFEVFPPMALRLFLLKTSYRNPIAFSLEALKGSEQNWREMEEVLRLAPWLAQQGQSVAGDILFDSWVRRFNEAMDDDFNTAAALAEVIALGKQLAGRYHAAIHGTPLADPVRFAREWCTFAFLCDILGLKAGEPEVRQSALPEAQIEAQIALRRQARAQRNWAEADRIRKQLLDQGIVLIDHKDKPTTWRHADP